MPRINTYSFVLWGEYFDELIAMTFITGLRAAGHHVKIIGLRGKQVQGIHGVAIATEITLAQALPLAYQACYVVIPCHSPYVANICNDPRLHEFLQRAQANDAFFVAGRVEAAELELLNIAAGCLMVDRDSQLNLDSINRMFPIL